MCRRKYFGYILAAVIPVFVLLSYCMLTNQIHLRMCRRKYFGYILAAVIPVFVVLSYCMLTNQIHLRMCRRKYFGYILAAVIPVFVLLSYCMLTNQIHLRMCRRKYFGYILAAVIPVFVLLSYCMLTNQIHLRILGKQNTKRQTTETEVYNDSSFSVINENMTIVTAYFNIGSFRKGDNLTFTSQLYLSWTKPFTYMLNPLVVFTDSEEFKKLMTKRREKVKLKTKIFLIERNTLWSFQLLNDIETVYSQPGYPKHYPNTVIPAYSCAQHAKYEIVTKTVHQKIFNTEFYAWLDIGYFRDIISDKIYFRMDPPSDIDRSRLSVNKVYESTKHIQPDTIMKENIIWVGGGMFIGTAEVIVKFEKLYQKAVKYFIDHHLMNTDQQVIYSLYSDEGRKALNPDVELQLFVPKGNRNPWFYLGYLCRHVIKLGGTKNK